MKNNGVTILANQQEENLVFFKSKFEDWYTDPVYKNKFVVIYKQTIKCVYDQFVPAIKFATVNFPQRNFIIQQVIRDEDKINFIKGAL